MEHTTITTRSITLKRSLTTLGAALVLAVAGVGIASAQTTTTTTTTTTAASAAQSGGVTVAQAPATPTPKKPLFTIHVGGISTFNVGSSDLPRPATAIPGVITGANACATNSCGATGQYAYADPVTHLTYGANVYLGKWTLNYAHSYIDQNIGRVGTGADATYTYQKLNDDYTDDASLSTTFWGQLGFAVGWHQRVRMCCGNDPNKSLTDVPIGPQTMWHDLYLQQTDRWGPNSKYFGKLIGLQVQEQFFPHNNPTHASCDLGGSGLGACSSGFDAVTSFVPYEYNKWHVQVWPNITFPVGGRDSTFALFTTYTNNVDYFLSSPIWYLYNQIDYGFIKKFPPYFTLTVTNSNLYQFKSAGYPYWNGDTINRNKLILQIDAALPFY
jgi:hypothetical protein